jgi:hypothetical protein
VVARKNLLYSRSTMIDPMKIPPEIEIKRACRANEGRPLLSGPGEVEKADQQPPYRSGRVSRNGFRVAPELTREFVNRREFEAPEHVLFLQLRQIVDRRPIARPVFHRSPRELGDSGITHS